jgi:SAM-dependent methyltransferase
MAEAPRLDADAVRAAWDRAADGYVARQRAGGDVYRSAFFGPAQIAMCGDVRGLRVLDVACGGGYFARAMAERGARVTTIDIAPRMIDLARETESLAPLGIDYRVLDAARLDDAFERESFDLATSCLALQDMPDPARVLRHVRALLVPGGRFVASITHPCTDTPLRRWERDEETGAKRWLCVDRYFERGPIEYRWPWWDDDVRTPALHVPLEDWYAWSLEAGFRIAALREPRPTAEALRAHPELEDAARVPYYVIFDLVRAG